MIRTILSIVTIIHISSFSLAIADDGIAALPEPSTLLLLGAAVAGLGIFLFWKSKKK